MIWHQCYMKPQRKTKSANRQKVMYVCMSIFIYLLSQGAHQKISNNDFSSAVEWPCAVDLYLVCIVCSQQVGGERLQFVLGHVLECRQAASSHCLLQVHSWVAHSVHSGRSQLVTGVQDLYCCYAHHTTVQGSWNTQTGKQNLDPTNLGSITWLPDFGELLIFISVATIPGSFRLSLIATNMLEYELMTLISHMSSTPLVLARQYHLNWQILVSMSWEHDAAALVLVQIWLLAVMIKNSKIS